MKKVGSVLVTGGAGFIGSYLVRRLTSEGFKVLVIDNLATGKEENIPNCVAFLKLDLGEESAYEQLKNFSCDAVFHLAGQSSGEKSFLDPFYDFKSHVLSTFWLLEWSKNKRIPRFIYASSMSVYGDPLSLPVAESHILQPKTFYATAKVCAESYIKLYQTLGIDTTIFRLFSVYGPGQNLENKMQGMLSIYLAYLLEGTPIIVKGSKERFRDFVYIDDVVDAWFNAFNNPISYGKVYNLGTGYKTKVEELVNVLKEYFEVPDYPVDYQQGTPGDQFGLVADISLIRKELNWKPKVNLRTGLQRMIDFERTKSKAV